MAVFIPYKPPTPLPKVGDGFETATLDLKAKADLTKTFHLAKDVAAFANHLGGNLIFGAVEKDGRVGRYVPLTEAEMNATQDAVSKAVAQRCSPKPLFDFGRYSDGAGFILTILVWPFLAQPVGVKAKGDVSAGGYGGDAYVFPVRSGSDSIFLLPEQLAMYMIPETRKTAVVLAQVPSGTKIKLHTVTAQGPGAPYAVKFLSSDMLTNSVLLEVRRSPGRATVGIPLEAVRAIWRDTVEWQVALRGAILNDNIFHWYD
jgi:hypothetical protein